MSSKLIALSAPGLNVTNFMTLVYARNDKLVRLLWLMMVNLSLENIRTFHCILVISNSITVSAPGHSVTNIYDIG